MIPISSMTSGYRAIVRQGGQKGTLVQSRNGATFEVLNFSFELSDPTKAMPVGINRKWNRGIAAAEAIQLIGGFSDPELLRRVAGKAFDPYIDGGAFHGAYGPRTRMQLAQVISRLARDPGTRQAVVTLWDPLHDLFVDGSADYPCTLSFQFMIRDGKLQMFTTMRSNDVWRGVAYDVFQFTQLQLVVAAALFVKPGSYYHHANSSHLYVSDLEKVNALHPASHEEELGALVNQGAVPPSQWPAFQKACRDLAADRNLTPNQLKMFDPIVLDWYANALKVSP